MTATPSLTVIFAENIRSESDDRFSIIGGFNDVAKAQPDADHGRLSLPMLAIYAILEFPQDLEFQHLHLALVFGPDHSELIKMTLAREILEDWIAPHAQSATGSLIARAQINFVNCLFPHEGVLRLRARINDHELLSNGLMIQSS